MNTPATPYELLSRPVSGLTCLSWCFCRSRKPALRWRAVAATTLLALGVCTQAGSILREVYEGISGSAISDLTSASIYPDSPTRTNFVTDYFEAPVDWSDNYGQRMHGYIVPPVTGNYTFWIASDDGSELWLSTDENPSNQRLVAWVGSWTSSREWTKEGNQQSAAISLQKDKAYYVKAHQKEGGGGDNLAVRWLRPDGLDEAPIPATYLLPYGTSFTPPIITQQPTNTTAIEGQMAAFIVKVSNLDLISFKWFRNGVVVPAATSGTLSYGPVTLDDNGARFSATLTNRLGSTNSGEAVLTVQADTTRPTLVSALNFGPTTIRLIYSEVMAVPGATNAANYGVNNGVSVNSVTFGPDNQTVLLTTSPLTFGNAYTITVNNVTDRARTPNAIWPNSSLTFTAVEYAPWDIGAPPLPGTNVPVAGGFDVTGSGRDIGGVSDQFHYSYQQRTGNFDLQVRLANVVVSDPFVHAGLMARENLNANARFAAIFASSAQLGCFFESRDPAGGTATTAVPVGGFPANYPQMWLRLQRSGTTLTGYASLDALTWVQLGSRSLSGLPSTLYLGFAVASETTNTTTTARFRDFGNALSTTTGTYTALREPLSPSSRRTGIVLSEIMYHPPGRADGKNLEFVELYNARSVFEDLTGWRLSGDVDYRFPDGFKLQAGDLVVIAANPADLQAVYGITNVLGPYTNSLPNQGGTLRLRNNADAIRLEVTYGDSLRWPAAADGAGHSLVLARPSYGEEDPQAWAASELRGGSPGQVDALYPTPLRSVVINEFLAHTDPPQLDALELYNHSNLAVDLSGCYLTDDPTTNKYRIAPGTMIAARGYLAYDADQLGFHLDAGGETLYLLDSNATRVLDAVRFEAQANGVSSGRWPDGAPTIRRLASPTLGARNTAWRLEDVVINEIMYNPISGNSDDEYVELHNRSGSALNLSGWRFIHGIDFTIPANTTLAANGYLVVAKNAARLMTNYPAGQLTTNNTVGDFSGTLGNAGDLIALAHLEDLVRTNALGDVLTNWVWVTQTETRYGSGGRWGRWADAGGSSLELIDPNADTLRPSNWADSNESQKGQWTTVSFTGTLDNGNANYAPDRLFLLMQGPGECAVDDVEVYKTGVANLVGNPGFESGQSGWQFFGNHSLSSVDATGAATGTQCLHVRGQGDGDTGMNSIRTPLTAGLSSGNTGILRAKVRWIAGWPEILFRLHGNYLEMPARMAVPTNLGTPGQVNSRRVANAGPAIYDVLHAPALPRAAQAVVVTCRVSDPDATASVTLRYRLDPNATLTTVTMRDDGAGSDSVAGDGVYSGQIPGQSSGTLLAFRIQATDAGSPAGASTFPPGAPGQECLVRWDDAVPFGSFAHYHLWNTQATENARNAVSDLDNTWRDATLVYGNQRVIYDVGFRDKGSPWHGGSGDIAVTAPTDDLLLGTTYRVFGCTGNGDNEATGIRSQLAAWLAQKLGIPYLNAHYMMLYRNGGNPWPIMEDLEQPNTYYAESWFPEGGEGDLYKIAMWFEFDDSNTAFNGATHATLERFLSQGSYKMARYRWNFQRRPQDGTANNYTNLFDLVTAANTTGTPYVPTLLNLADVEQWMRCEVFDRAMGNWDAWGYNVGQNMFIYKQPGLKWVLLPWDIDFTFGRGDGATTALWGTGNEPVLSRIYGEPAFTRMLWRAYLDVVNGPFLAQNYGPQIDARRKVLLQNNHTELSEPADIKAWIEQRRTYILSQLSASDVPALTITSNSGNDYTSATPTTTLTGRAPFAAATIEINGVPYPATWTDRNTFRITVPLTQVTNLLTFVGQDLRGNPVPGATDTITVTYTGAVQQPEDYVVLNEVHYNPTLPNASFVELYNRSTTTPFDLSGFRLEGLGYTFPDGALIPASGYLLLVKDRQAFANAFGQTLPVYDEFPGSLDNGGELLALVKPGVTPAGDLSITDLRYDNRLPWPSDADGLGPSLQLVDAAQDEYRVGNWAATTTNDVNRVTPGRANSVRQTLTPFPPIWINEVLPNNISGPVDNAGDHDPWIELYNAGTTNVDLSPFYLTDNYTNLTRWPFPPGLTIGPQQFLLIWADSETAETATGAPHTNFRLNPTNGSVALVRYQGSPGAPAVMDYLDYAQLPPDRSFGSYPDGEPRKRRLFYYATPGATNNPAYPQIQVTINEFMALNGTSLADPADQDYEDWFELYNAGSSAVDLTSYSLTDNLTNRNEFVVPPGYVMPPGGFLLVWADKETGQNKATNLDLHASFKLSSTNGDIGLFSPDGVLVDSVSYGTQTSDVSAGRFPDGGALPLYSMDLPTPRSANMLSGANRPPTLDPIGNRTVAEQTLLSFTATATDLDAGQTVTFSLSADAPPGASLDANTGLFTWTPSEAQGPGPFSFTVRATDNGVPARSTGERITVTVTEINRAPTLAAIASQTVNEGSLLSLTASASDPDLPMNGLTFTLGPGAPAGAAIDPTTGVFTWTPTEAQGPANYTLAVIVADSGSPPLSATNAFNVTVNEVNNPPAMSPVSPQTVEELSLFTLKVTATDPDAPPSGIVYGFDTAPAGAQINVNTGVITWTPTEAQGPTNAVFIVRATETAPPNPSSAITFSVTVTEKNQAPALAAIPDHVVLEGQTLRVQASATDADLPRQTLTYTLLPGAPSGASIDPATGLLTWTVDVDQGANTNTLSLQVNDNGPGALAATRTFAVVVQPQWHAVINEIMYRPAVTNAEYLELHNNSAKTPVDLSGIRLVGSNLVFNFANGTTLQPGQFLLVARSLSAFAATYTNAGPVAGSYTGSLGTNADTLRLIRPGSTSDQDVVLDEVTYASGAPWPSPANGGGASLQLLDPKRDNDRAGNWSAPTTAAPQWQYVTATGTAADPRLYLYLNAAGSVDVDDIMVVAGSTPDSGANLIQNGAFESSLATGWTTTANTANSSIGTAVKHSGNSSLHLVCNATGTTATDCLLQSASVTAGSTYTLSYWFLPNTNGANLTVRFSGSWITTTTNVLFNPGPAPAPATPAASNTVATSLSEFPTLRINEVVTRNATGIMDGTGKREPWIELVNTGTEDLNLDGLYLALSYTNLTNWAFPTGWVVPAGGFTVVFADGEPAQTSATELHTGFRLPTISGTAWSVVLSRLQNSLPAVVDYLDGVNGVNDTAIGRLPDGEPASVVTLAVPTPGASNQILSEFSLTDIWVATDGSPAFSWETMPGRTYQVQVKLSLEAGSAWQALGNVSASGATTSFTDTASRGATQRYYQVLLLP
jgi:hypothetical protein